ncbi:MAG: substrate-binding domain-containing protein [Opitutales bacterium]|nr:substrate-binding domain-containing protein [Opitutales bacterium]MCH8540376.1 substrate-binding domain-containing protein [Opitutales bacterium]
MDQKHLNILVSCSNDEGIVGPILQGFQSWISERTQWTILNPAIGNFPSTWLEDPVRHLKQVDFVLLLGMGTDELFNHLLESFRGRVLTTYVGSCFGNAFWSVGPGQKEIGQVAGHCFLESGRQHFALGLYVEGAEWQEERVRGFEEVIGFHHFTCDSCLLPLEPWITISSKGDMFYPVSERGSLRENVFRWIQELPAKTGIFCVNDDIARYLLSVAIETGRDIPGDLSILGVDNQEYLCESIFPQISSIDMGWAEIGRRMAQIIDESSLQKNPIAKRETVNSLSIRHRGTSLPPDKRHLILYRAIQYLKQHLQENPSLEEVAEAIGSQGQGRILGNLFSELYGQTFSQTRNQLLIDFAKELLASKNLSNEEISHQCGFSEPSSFYRWFKRSTGKNPGDLRPN